MKDHVQHNKKFWDRDADAYQAAHGDALRAAPCAWGAYRVPEKTLNILGDVRDRDVLEFGCGAAQWAIALNALGARAFGLDLSTSQLAHARRVSTTVPLVQASGEAVPFADQQFDIVFCDHGAISFCNPTVTIPECARILRPQGLLAFCVTHPLLYLTWDNDKQKQTRRLNLTYEDLGRMDFGDGTIDWSLPASEWFSVLRTHGFVVEDVIELRAAKDAETTYEEFAPPRWARRWPAEWIWKARRSYRDTRGTNDAFNAP